MSFPKSYTTVAEDIWHWTPEISSEEKNLEKRSKNKLYLDTLTFKETDHLDQILLHKLRYKSNQS